MIEPHMMGNKVTKPGYGDSKPAKPVHTCDSQEMIDFCLDHCAAPPELCKGTCWKYGNKRSAVPAAYGLPRKPENPYRRGSLIWSVMEGNWEDLTISQIAEVLGTTDKIISAMLSRIKKETGYYVPRARMSSE